jgi:EAL domain-containing protein (putative c-di-GMP-specific phosphodiesterase class I)/GGDEF domain-containing protein
MEVKFVNKFFIMILFSTSLFPSTNSLQEELNDARTTNEMLLLSLFLLIWLLYRVRVNQRLSNKKREDLHKLVYFNEITQFPNRNKFNLDMKSEKLLNYKGSMACFVIDNISRFYELYSSEKIEEILNYIKNLILAFENIDYTYHYDNGIFILFMSENDQNNIRSTCKMISEKIVLDIRENISVSFGIHVISEKENLHEVYKLTRVAARLAKRFSYDKILYADHKEIKKYQESLKIEEDIPRAIMQNEFVPYFQPKVNLKTNEVVGCEALIRWKHYTGNLILPVKFIEIAENNNSIIDLDLMIAEKSIEIVKEWIDSNKVNKNFKLSFNLSAKTFISPGIIFKITSLLKKYDFNPLNLEIELTETIVISDYEHFSNIIEELHSLGISIALDDFTAGFSSMEYLTNLHIDTVKLDRALIIDTENNNEKGIKKRRIYKLLSQMINEMNLLVISEGLDDERHLELIKGAQIQIGQGFYFSEPLSEDDFIKYVENKKILLV